MNFLVFLLAHLMDAGGFVEDDVVKACEMGAVAETVFALVLIAAFMNR